MTFNEASMFNKQSLWVVILQFTLLQPGLAAQLRSHGQTLAVEAGHKPPPRLINASAVQAPARVSASASLRGSLLAAVGAFAGADANGDTLWRPWFAMDSRRSKDGPATLAEYCAAPVPQESSGKIGVSTKIARKVKIGALLSGRVADKSSSGSGEQTFKYADDIMAGKRPGQNFLARVRQSQAAAKPQLDPACKMQSFLKKLQELLASERAKLASRMAGPPVLQKRDQELAHTGVRQTYIDIDQTLAEAKMKHDELEKDGSLDPELRAIIVSIIQSLEKMSNKVDNLIALEAKARAVKQKAKLEGKEAEETKRQLDAEIMRAARQVSKAVSEAEKAAAKLNTGFHPHGAKWWRYEYEHSYVQSLIMIIISFLMLIWSELVRRLKPLFNILFSHAGVASNSDSSELQRQTQDGAIYVHWLYAYFEQMLVCVLVFLTVLLMAKTRLADYVPQLIRPSEDMRVPKTGEEYCWLALEICPIFFFAIVFYFGLMYAVAHRTRMMMSSLGDFEGEPGAQVVAQQKKQKANSSAQAVSPLTISAEDFETVKSYFLNRMRIEMASTGSPMYGDLARDLRLGEIGKLLNNDLDAFPLWMYLKLNVCTSVGQFFSFSWAMWVPAMWLFLVCTMCHRFAHTEPLQIMHFFAVATLAILAFMAWYTKRVSSKIQKGQAQALTVQKDNSFQKKINTKCVVLNALQFTLFFVCYGVSRMICQPWLWEVHFWPVLSLTLVALFSLFIFVWLVSPAIPCFCAVMAIPPYMDEDSLLMMYHAAEIVSHKSSPQAPPSSYYVRKPHSFAPGSSHIAAVVVDAPLAAQPEAPGCSEGMPIAAADEDTLLMLYKTLQHESLLMMSEENTAMRREPSVAETVSHQLPAQAPALAHYVRTPRITGVHRKSGIASAAGGAMPAT